MLILCDSQSYARDQYSMCTVQLPLDSTIVSNTIESPMFLLCTMESHLCDWSMEV